MSSSPVSFLPARVVSEQADLVTLLGQVPDPRKRRGVRHPVAGLLAVAVSAVVAGAQGFTAIGEWARDAGGDVLARLGLSTPAEESTFRRLFAAIDPDVLDAVIGTWAATRAAVVGGRRVIAIDGKTVRGARTGAEAEAAPHLVAALAHGAGLVLGQVAVATKSNEIPAARQLLEHLDLAGAVITMDAMHTQRETAARITAGGGDYVFTVKGNQCATRRSDAFPPQAGGTRREVPGSDGLPGVERRRGQQHVRKPAAGSGCLGRCVGKTRTVWQRLDCLNPNLQRQQFTAAGTASVTGVRRGRGVTVRLGRPSRRKRCPVRALKEMSGVPAAVLDTCIGDERGITVPALGVGGDGVLVVVAGVASGRGGRESRSQGEGAQAGAGNREPWRYA